MVRWLSIAALCAGLLSPATLRQVAAAELPPPAVLLALLRGTMSALNQANVTGNYSVLRDLSAPTFREANSNALLADRFRMWRDRKLDFAAVLLLDAQLSRPPAIDPEGALRLSGYFPTAPLRVAFDLVYQPVGGNWRIAVIDAHVSEVEPEVTGSLPARSSAAVKEASTVRDASRSRVAIPTPPGDRPRI